MTVENKMIKNIYTNSKRSAGFTLIELLVVVLIIGILSSVALPQYKNAVLKSRVSTVIPLLKNAMYALDAYHLANGEFTREWDRVDIVPSGCTHNTNSNAADIYVCGNDWLLTLDVNGMAMANYCPNKNTSWSSCTNARDFQIIAYASDVVQSGGATRVPGAIGCYGFTTEGQKICTLLSKSGTVINAN